MSQPYRIPPSDHRFAVGLVAATGTVWLSPMFDGINDPLWLNPLASTVPCLYHSRDYGDLTTFEWVVRTTMFMSVGILIYEAFF